MAPIAYRIQALVRSGELDAAGELLLEERPTCPATSCSRT